MQNLGITKWALAAATVLLGAVWIGSMFRGVTWRGQQNGVVIFRGAIDLFWSTVGAGKQQIWWMKAYPSPIQWWVSRDSGSASTGPWESVCIPLWMAWLPVLVATGAVWRIDFMKRKRAKDLLCAGCGYSRAGLANGQVCPECGATMS